MQPHKSWGFSPNIFENERSGLTPNRVKSERFFVMPNNSRPKIALVANTAWNLWNFRRALIESLVNEGVEVICFAPEDGFEAKLQDITGVQFIPLRHLSRKSLSPFSNLHTLAELTRHLRREQPDLAVFYTVKPNIFGSFASRLTGTPAIAMVEGLGYAATASPMLRRLIFWLYHLAFRFVKKVVFLNHDDRAEFLYHHVVRPDKTLVIKGTGVDTSHFYPEENTASEPVFLFIGRLLSDKGIREFVQAAKQVKATVPQTRFQLLGSTDTENPASIESSELFHWIENQSVEYLGQTDDVRPFIARSGVVVLPSYREGMPRALLEGMAMGKPIITTDSVGCRETVEEGRNGFIVPSENAAALAGAMLRFLQLPLEQQHAMGRYSRQKAASEFSNEIIIPQYLQLIREALPQRKERQ
jgi:glycosyltransferase involved in cell wall biosynthesis